MVSSPAIGFGQQLIYSHPLLSFPSTLIKIK
jgi:hypothetical protein